MYHKNFYEKLIIDVDTGIQKEHGCVETRRKCARRLRRFDMSHERAENQSPRKNVRCATDTHTRPAPARPCAPHRFLLPPALLNSASLLLALWCVAPVSRANGAPPPVSQMANTNFEFFKKFVNGQVPIKEGMMYRTLWKNGRVVNREQWLFSLQDGGRSWYVYNVTFNRGHQTMGASLTQLWCVGDKLVDVVDKTRAKGSTVYDGGFVMRGFLREAVSLGIPFEDMTVEMKPVKWTGTHFESLRRAGVGPRSVIRVAHGKVRLRDGRPSELVDDHGRITAIYEYQDMGPIPRAWTQTVGPYVVRDELVRLELGTNALCGARGFLPGSFARSANLLCFVETNGATYAVTERGLWNTADRVKASPRTTGSVAMIAIVVAAFSALFAYYIIQKKER